MEYTTPTNRELAEIVFTKMHSYGFRPYDIEYGDSYFLFNLGPDSVVHFRLKGLSRHWKFGMWIFSDLLKEDESAADGQDDQKNSNVIELFAQYDTQIDKFKPSASSLVVSFDASEWRKRGTDSRAFTSLKRMLQMMRRHPLICHAEFCGDMHQAFYPHFFLVEFIRDEWRILRYDLSSFVSYVVWVPYTYLKCGIARRSRCIENLELVNFEKSNPGWRSDHLIEIRIQFSENSTDAEDEAWLRRWFRREAYGRYSFYGNMIVIRWFMKVGREDHYRIRWIETEKT